MIKKKKMLNNQHSDNFYWLKLVKKGFTSLKNEIQYLIDQRNAEKEAMYWRK